MIICVSSSGCTGISQRKLYTCVCVGGGGGVAGGGLDGGFPCPYHMSLTLINTRSRHSSYKRVRIIVLNFTDIGSVLGKFVCPQF